MAAAGEVKWGIMGTAGIAQKVCLAIHGAPNAKIHAIASRDLHKCKKYAADNAPDAKCYGSYDELLEDAEIQVVYLPLPTAMRAEWVLKAAAKKKHVLCEKPLGADMSVVQRMLEACRSHGVQFMDNTMFMHGALLPKAKQALRDTELMGAQGVRHVTSCFSIPYGMDPDWAQNNIRMKKDSEPLGCLGDLGWYNVRVTLWAFDYDLPEAVSCHFLETTNEGVPVRVAATFKFSGGRSATFDCSFMHPWRQWVEITGSSAQLRIDDFVIPKSQDPSFLVERNTMGDKAVFIPHQVLLRETASGLPHQNLVENMSNIALSGVVEDFWPEVSAKTSAVLAACMASGGKDGAWEAVSR